MRDAKDQARDLAGLAEGLLVYFDDNTTCPPPDELMLALTRDEVMQMADAAAALRAMNDVVEAAHNAMMFAHEDYGGAPSIRDTGAIERLGAALARVRGGKGE